MKRVVKIFKADVHGLMDRLEDEGLLLKQHLREMSEALNRKEVHLNRLQATLKQSQQEYDKHRQQSKALEQDLAVAIQKNKDDIARMLIKKIKPLDSLRDEIAERIKHLDEEYSFSREQLDQQRLRYEGLKHRSAEYFHKTPFRELRRNPAHNEETDNYGELSAEEIELELLKRKEALGAV